MPEVGTRGLADLQLQRGELWDRRTLLVRANRGISFPCISRITIENLSFEVAISLVSSVCKYKYDLQETAIESHYI